MRKRHKPFLPAIVLPLTAAFAPLTASAHHSFAMYDATKLVNVVGTVKEFQWTNPHVILWVVKDAEGGAAEGELWTMELPTSTGNLSRMGWSKRSLVPGDRVTVEINPLRDGQHGGSFKKATVAGTGKVLTANPPPMPDAGAADQTPAPTGPTGQQAADAKAETSKAHGGCSTASAPLATPPYAALLAVLALLAQRIRLRRARR